MRTYEEQLDRSFDDLLQEADAYFMETGKLHAPLAGLTRRLDEADIPYAVLGAIALARHGYRRMTVDIDVLLTPEGLAAFKERFLGCGYDPAFPGATKSFRAAATGVRVDVITTGEYPGDGLPKPVRFPNPSEGSVEIAGVRVMTLEKLIELKLASGMSAPHRLRDLADVQDTIRTLHLPPDLADRLDSSVRSAYLDLWRQAQTPDPIQDL
ncbi:MAG: hypothetical protein HYR60_05765 [Acidobacteria bacterium]|nr:hypothetical protein [Acidobacteriota bacterium]